MAQNGGKVQIQKSVVAVPEYMDKKGKRLKLERIVSNVVPDK